MDRANTHPLWLVEVAIEPKSKADREKFDIALANLAAEDPSFHVSTDKEVGQTILKGMDERHLDTKIDVLRRTYNLDANIGALQVAFRERVTRRVEVAYTHKRVHGPKGEFADVKFVVEPGEPDSGFAFESKADESAVPKEYIPGVENGLNSVMSSGVVAGFPVVDVKVQLVDGKHHDIDSSVVAFEIASRMAFREALLKGKSVLLEPMMRVEIVTPKDCVGSLIDDLILRRGQILGHDMLRIPNVINAIVPLINMFGYVNSLGLMSRERATFAMQFDHYAPVPTPEDDPPFRPATGMRA